MHIRQWSCASDEVPQGSIHASKKALVCHVHTQYNDLLHYTAVKADTRRVTLYRPNMITSYISCLNVTMHQCVCIAAVRQHASRSIATFTGLTSIRSCLRGVLRSEAKPFTSCTIRACTSSNRVLGVRFNGLRFCFRKDVHKNNGILAFVDRFSKIVHLVVVSTSITEEGCAHVFVNAIFRLHGLFLELRSDRDSRSTTELWRSVSISWNTAMNIYSRPSGNLWSDRTRQ